MSRRSNGARHLSEWTRNFPKYEMELWVSLRRRVWQCFRPHAPLETYRAVVQDLAQLVARAVELESKHARARGVDCECCLQQMRGHAEMAGVDHGTD